MLIPSFNVPSKNSSTPNDGMIYIASSHSKIQDFVLPYLARGEDENTDLYSTLGGSKSIVLDEVLFDFGCRYRLVVHKVASGGDCEKNDDSSTNVDLQMNKSGFKRDVVVAMHVAITQWEDVRESAVVTLRSMFGSDSILEDSYNSIDSEVENSAQGGKHESVSYPFPNLGTVCSGYNVTVQIQSKSLPLGQDPDSCTKSIAKIRVIILGKQIQDSFDRMISPDFKDGKQTLERNTNKEEAQTFTIPIQSTRRNKKGRCSSSSSYLYNIMVSSQSDRVTIVFPVDFEDETDRALARLYLQQFERAQRSASAKNAPICEYRRGVDPPREILTFLTNTEKVDIAGFFSFTFLESHVTTEERRKKATENMVMFLTYIEYHVTCSKSYIHSRMRQKKDVLLERLLPKQF